MRRSSIHNCKMAEAIGAAMNEEEGGDLHIAMYPWFAMGHLIPFLQLANKLAQKRHRISLIVPKNTQSKLHQFNLFPHLITFVPITVPHCEELPENAETTADIPPYLIPLLMTAMDRTEKDIEQILQRLKPHFVFFDFTEWLPDLSRKLGIKSLQYLAGNPATAAYVLSPQRMLQGIELTEADLMKPPSGFPCSSIDLHFHEAKLYAFFRKVEFGSSLSLFDRLYIGSTQTDAIAFKGSTQIEGLFVDHLANQFGKHVLLSGPAIPHPPSSSVLDEKWSKWLAQFKGNSVIYCALGSECILEKTQFQELLLGLELTGFPFLAALKPPSGFESVESAMPEGFQERIKERGIIDGGWVQQQEILGHPSVGCFITHCGSGSTREGLVSTCQLVLLPCVDLDQIINARMMSKYLKVGVEVEKGEQDGLFTRESVCEAVRSVMDAESEVGKEIRKNHSRFRSHLLSIDLESSYVDSFCNKLRELLK